MLDNDKKNDNNNGGGSNETFSTPPATPTRDTNDTQIRTENDSLNTTTQKNN